MDRTSLIADETADRAAALFAESGAVELPVYTRDSRRLGVVRDRDLVVRVLAQGADPCTTRVREIVRRPAPAAALSVFGTPYWVPEL
jgi:CBS domain-containing protein